MAQSVRRASIHTLANISSIELLETDTLANVQASHIQSALPPADTGSAAWLCLAGCFMANAMIWGFAFSFGLLQEHYSTHEPFASKPAGIAAIGTTATGVGYLTMPIFFAIYRQWPRARRLSTWLGLPAVAGSLVAASFATSVAQLVVCQGFLYAIAGNAVIVPTIIYLDEWFIQRKGLAVGIMWAGDGTGGAIVPLVMNALLETVGFRWTLRAIAGLMVLLVAPFLYFLRPRLPTSGSYAPRPLNINFIKSHIFWILQTFNTVQALGYFLPSNYLPMYAQSIGLGTMASSYTLLVLNTASVLGCVSVGLLVDRYHVTTVLIVVSLLAGISVFAIWGVSASIASLYTFCVVYGISAGGYSTTWGGIVRELQRQQETADTSMIFGFLALGRGVGAMISGPLSEALLHQPVHAIADTAATGYSGTYGALIAFAGSTALVGGSSWLCRRVGMI